MPRPGLIRSLLFGQGRQALLEHLREASPQVGRRVRVAANGYQLPSIRDFNSGSMPVGQRVLHNLKTLAVGDNAPEILRQRLMQGGVLGSGGVLHGSVAANPNIRRDINRLGAARALWRNKGGLFSSGLNASLMMGVPGYATYKSIERGDASGLGRAVGEGLGWTVAAPFATSGAAIAMPLGLLGRRVSETALLPQIRPANMNALPDIDAAAFQNYT